MCFVLYGKGFLFVYNTKLGLFVFFSLFLAKGLLFVCNNLGIFSFIVFTVLIQMYSTNTRFGFSTFPLVILV